MGTAAADLPPLRIVRGGHSISVDPPIVAAPMAGAIDPPYRTLLHRYGCKLSFTEMVNARGLVSGSARSISYTQVVPESGLSGVQLFGADIRYMSKAAALMEEKGYHIIDLNAGCPKRKVISHGAGGALLNDPAKLVSLMGCILDAVKVPSGLKMRSAYRELDRPSLHRLLKDLEGCGASYITMHARTVSQGFTGRADRSVIDLCAGSVDVPIIASGDVKAPSDVLDYLQRGASGVMVGRALLGDPTWFRRCENALLGGEWTIYPSTERDLNDLLDIAKGHLGISISTLGEGKGVRDMRPHLSWYLSKFKGRSVFRDRLFSLRRRSEVESFLEEVRGVWVRELKRP